jgi:hypothetical protein
VVTHVRHALQHTAAIGACSPYFAAVSAMRPCQTVFTASECTDGAHSVFTHG